MIHPLTRSIAILGLLLTLLIPCLSAGCHATPSSSRDGQAGPASQPAAQTLEPGQRIEAVIIEPASAIKRRRVRGIIDAQGRLALDALGTFNTTGQTLTQLQQTILTTHNNPRKLQGTVRLLIVQLETTGLFIALTPQQAQALRDDEEQLRLLDAGDHPTLQWITLPAPPSASQESLPAFDRLNQRLTPAFPAGLELVGHALKHNVQDFAHQAVSSRPTSPVGLAIRLRSQAGQDLAQASVSHLGQPLLVVHQNQCIWSATITHELSDILVLRSGDEPFTPEQAQALEAVFKPSPR